MSRCSARMNGSRSSGRQADFGLAGKGGSVRRNRRAAGPSLRALALTGPGQELTVNKNALANFPEHGATSFDHPPFRRRFVKMGPLRPSGSAPGVRSRRFHAGERRGGRSLGSWFAEAGTLGKRQRGAGAVIRGIEQRKELGVPANRSRRTEWPRRGLHSHSIVPGGFDVMS